MNKKDIIESLEEIINYRLKAMEKAVEDHEYQTYGIHCGFIQGIELCLIANNYHIVYSNENLTARIEKFDDITLL